MKKKLIAETAWHHQGNESFMLRLIDELCSSKVDSIKIHLLIDMDEYMLPDHPLYNQLKDWMLSMQCWEKIIGNIKNSGKELIVLCNDKKSIDFCLHYDPEGLELHAATVHDTHLFNHLIKKTAGTGKHIFLGIGAIPIEEIDRLYQTRALKLALMFGVQNFPTKPEYLALARQRRLMNFFPEAVYGYADHTEWNNPENLMISLLGGLDKTYIEKHVTIEPGKKRVDYESAISVDHVNKLRDLLDLAEKIEGDGLLSKNLGETQYGQIGPMRKAKVAAKDFKAGESIDIEYIRFARTVQSSDLLPVMLGKPELYQFKHDVLAGSVITSESLGPRV